MMWFMPWPLTENSSIFPQKLFFAVAVLRFFSFHVMTRSIKQKFIIIIFIIIALSTHTHRNNEWFNNSLIMELLMPYSIASQ